MTAEILGRQVDPASAPIAADILPEVHQLQPRADPIRHRHQLRIPTAVEREDDAADRIGGALTVGDQFVARLIPDGDRSGIEPLVLVEGVEEVGERLDPHRGAARRVGQRHKQRMIGAACEAGLEPPPPPLQRLSRCGRRGRLVGEVVAPPSVGVDIGEILTEPGRNDPTGHGEVLVVTLRDPPAPGLGGGQIEVGRHLMEGPRGGIARVGIGVPDGNRRLDGGADHGADGFFLDARREQKPWMALPAES